jgi:hypothetical protein
MKFWLGNEDRGVDPLKIKWLVETFERDTYTIIDEGYFYYDKYVIFEQEKDALLYRLKWE